MKITRLRLLGFKSFVEPTELVIERGLTGVVGPNGCGKSNLLEALRWVMGETSHKSMRAAAMDDVIFSGTTGRPARNSAEVTIFVDNKERKAPPDFNDHDVIEITRRIEREAGSAYRINGREARARDVKILFEDAATGARSPALVRQGQIGEIVNSKPEQRRRILEDAAGIAGLHSRRHEAELRLKAAEGNLARIGDVLGQLASQIESLKRQARHARRYKEISADIRRQEALLAHLAWSAAQAGVAGEEAELVSVLSILGLAVEASSRALREESEVAAQIPPLREAEMVRAGVLGRLKIELETLEREAVRSRERESELKARLAQLEADAARESNFIAEAGEIEARLDEELATLQTSAPDDGGPLAAAEAARKAADDALAAGERRLAELAGKASESRARQRSLETSLAERQEQVSRLKRQLTQIEILHREAAGRAPDAVKLTATTQQGQQLASECARIEALTTAAEEAARHLSQEARSRRDAAQKARLAASLLRTEHDTLAKLLLAPRDANGPPVSDLIEVRTGYETALGAALGDDLEATLTTKAPLHWRRLDVSLEDQQLPAEAEPLIRYVEGPVELARRLKQIGVVDRAVGAKLQPLLKPGQRLVSREGDLWRWDGFAAAAHGTTAAAQRMAARNRLADLALREEEERTGAELLEDAASDAAAALLEAETKAQELRRAWRETQARLAETREAMTVIERAARETESRLSSLAEQRSQAEDDLVAASERLTEVELSLETLDEDAALGAALEDAHAAAQALRLAASEARASCAALEREQRVRRERVTQMTAERQRWLARRESAEQQAAILQQRIAETSGEIEQIGTLPAQIEERRQQLLDDVADADKQRREAADALVSAEARLKAAAEALRTSHGAVANAREQRARVEARLESARAKRTEEARRIRDLLDCDPEGCLKRAGIEEGIELPALVEVDRTLVRLKADRERLGAVNLQADDELQQLFERHSGLDAERADVEQAIARLRGAIGQLNREGKKRLFEAFEIVNAHFQRLFSTLFGGGEARLEMVESQEDPLEGGLEIIAKPPGKKPATLSLLSGGEQTLTALSLIFAVFLTNPSPICVLDEVDAPLDDANVDRFCTLMERMAQETATRFLVITHHPMTMSRMSRLFGVTMAERGVSMLVSVNLETAQSFREAV